MKLVSTITCATLLVISPFMYGMTNKAPQEKQEKADSVIHLNHLARGIAKTGLFALTSWAGYKICENFYIKRCDNLHQAINLHKYVDYSGATIQGFFLALAASCVIYPLYKLGFSAKDSFEKAFAKNKNNEKEQPIRSEQSAEKTKATA